ncbi:uncharacterized protein LOC125191685 [Salvia hispanica]|uniref:uncharacterized protein LOC125191685 n=1 Tax=Salvia hispanica TaxID=49212 RepID=UPI002009C5AB|nr:uncharacterized protein LOC125191685 [Salvia hispanica]
MAMVMKSSDDEREETQPIMSHFSHRHPLEASELHVDDHGVCSGCEHDVVGPAYVCTKATCHFLLHGLCSDLPRRLRHRCHPAHPLSLLPSPPYADGEFTCDACGRSGHGFTYHCGACEFDIHVECASLPEVEDRRDVHQHALILTADLPDGRDMVCCVCDDLVGKGLWMYCCLACNCALHLTCA